MGASDGKGYTVNVPLSEGAGEGEYAAAFERIVLPVAEAFAPELVLISAGFDAHRKDPLANMHLEAKSYAQFTAALERVASKSAQGRIALLLEGGYDLGALEASLSACLLALRDAGGTEPSSLSPAPRHATEIARAQRVAGAFWPACGSS